MSFPPDFVWGVATAAYQIEGAVAEDGRGESIWDRFSHTPGKTENGDTGDIACDHYHRWAEDVDLLADLGIPAYRFSVAWPRIQPVGSGPPNRQGLAFYDGLVDRLLARGIKPVVTLCHFDLPQSLEDTGGWTDRDTAHRFAAYAELVFDTLGDRVALWITHNELYAQAAFGYLHGLFPPGRTGDVDGFFKASHHLLLSHGLAVQAYRDAGFTAPIGTTVGLAPTYPETRSPSDLEAAQRWDGLENRWFLEALFTARYPEDVSRILVEAGADTSAIEEGDLSVIAQPIDFLGVNYYTHRVVRDAPDQLFRCMSVPTGVRTTETGWEIVPDGLYDLLERLASDYPELPLYLTENGAAFTDHRNENGEIHDSDRIRYLRDHIEMCEQAIDAGVNLRGYFAWSFLDNFEWQLGFRPRFGIVHVDFDSQLRTPKASASFFRQIAATNKLPDK